MGTQHRMTDFPSGMDAERTYIHAPCCLIRSCFSIQPRLPQLHVFKRCATACCFYLLAAAALSCTDTEKEKMQTLILSLESHTTGEAIPITVETAITVDEQQRGFMHRDDIPDGTGMIFIYKSDTRLRFWMKDTPHPLSIAFIDSAGRIREISDMQPFSLDVISSTHSVRYALEVPAGYFTRAGITIGDTLSRESLAALKSRAGSF